MAESGNTLLHVDEHSDMSLPRLHRSIRRIGNAVEFTYSQLDIGNFIWPAVYQGIFNRVLWLKRRHRNGSGWQRMLVCAKNAEATEFITGSSLAGTPYADAADARPMEFSRVTTADTLRTDQPVVLDIDLDYFRSNEFPDFCGKRVEITRAAYEEFAGDPYHFLRISPGSDVRAINPNSRADGALDADGDGSSNAREFRAGTNPRDPSSVLKLTRFENNGTDVRLFVSSGGLGTCAVETSTNVLGPWVLVQSFGAGTRLTQAVVDQGGWGGEKRFYRLRSY